MDPLAQTRQSESTASNTFRLTAEPPVFTRGEGPFLFTADGARYVDFVCGSATTSLGHGHPAHLAAIESVLRSGILHTGTRLPSAPRAALYAKLQTHLPSHLSAIHLANSGAEAVETAIKAAMHVTGRRHFIAFEGGYHGRTLGALALTHAEHLRVPFEPWAAPWVSFAPYAATDAQAAAALKALEMLLGNTPPCAALVIEAVQGVAGVLGPSTVFLQGVQRLAHAHGALLILDEIWSGLGRSGRWFAHELADLEPDLVALGKSLSASLPLSAVAGRPEVLQSWKPGTHTSTFQGNPAACAAAVATLETLESEALAQRAETTLAPMVLEAFKDRTVRVVGAQSALELGSPEAAIEVQKQALAEGILVYGSGSRLMLLPPLNIPEQAFAEALSRLRPLLPRPD